MRKTLLAIVAGLFCGGGLLAQTTGTFIVADNGSHMSSCLDTNITLNDIYTQLAIRDLHDSNEDVTNYRLLELNGSLITQNEITGSFKFSDYSSIYIEKKNTTLTGHNGVQVFLNIITPPTTLFKIDTLEYVVDKGEKAKITEDFFNTALDFWTSGKDVLGLQERILFMDMSTDIERPISEVPSWALLEPGLYRIVHFVSVCEASDIFRDTLFVKVTESLCHSIQVKGSPSFCRDEIADIRPFVYIDGHIATEIELDDMTFYNQSNSSASGSVIDPSAIDMSEFIGTVDYFPKIKIEYQPNVTLGTCDTYNYVLDTRVPTPIVASSNVLFVNDNYNNQQIVTVESQFYAFDNVFHKNVLQEMYLDNYNVYDGTTFHFYTDAAYQNEITASQIPAGDYYLLALNPACDEDSAKFSINVKEANVELFMESELNQGKGYYTFTAPSYPGATYEWMQWGGAIVSGLGTNQVLVYYSENASHGVFITCKITVPSPSAKLAEGEEPSVLYAALYLTEDENGDKIEITSEVPTGISSFISSGFTSAYPNPAEGAISFTGDKEFDLKVINAMGQTIFEQKNYTPNTPIHINEKGIHVAHLTQNGKTHSIKIVLR
ncbi:MAG TPA: T9SS type A sorting domain-containing protein [Cytophagaceae bacterium]